MGVEKDQDEIELGDALYLVKSNKSVFVWIGGRTNQALHELLEIDKEKVIDVNPYVIMDKESYPKELLNYERPIFVCHHGIASYELVKELASNNISGYSLAGGIEGIKSRA